MAEFVSLPIYGSNGMATGRSLRINVRFFLGSAGVLANRFMEIVDEAPGEIEQLNRIVSGLPPQDFKKENERAYIENGRLESISFTSREEGIGTVTLVDVLNDKLSDQLDIPRGLMDVSSAHPRPEWRQIPGYSDYIMSSFKMVATAADEKSVSIMRGRLDNVLITDDAGVTRRMSLDHLFRVTFPEFK